jgi:hypothetical protein
MSPGVEQSEVKFCGEILERELQFCIRAIDKVKANESSWNYLNGWDSLIYMYDGPSLIQSIQKLSRLRFD